jgi:hypothetical protein
MSSDFAKLPRSRCVSSSRQGRGFSRRASRRRGAGTCEADRVCRQSVRALTADIVVPWVAAGARAYVFISSIITCIGIGAVRSVPLAVARVGPRETTAEGIDVASRAARVAAASRGDWRSNGQSGCNDGRYVASRKVHRANSHTGRACPRSLVRSKLYEGSAGGPGRSRTRAERAAGELARMMIEAQR